MATPLQPVDVKTPAIKRKVSAIKVMQHVRTRKWKLRCLVHPRKGATGVRRETSYIYDTRAEAEADIDNVVAGLERKRRRTSSSPGECVVQCLYSSLLCSLQQSGTKHAATVCNQKCGRSLQPNNSSVSCSWRTAAAPGRCAAKEPLVKLWYVELACNVCTAVCSVVYSRLEPNTQQQSATKRAAEVCSQTTAVCFGLIGGCT